MYGNDINQGFVFPKIKRLKSENMSGKCTTFLLNKITMESVMKSEINSDKL